MEALRIFRFMLLPCLLLMVVLSGANAQPPAPAEIKVGGTMAMTGRFAAEVAPFGKLVDAWASVINEQGGIYLKEYGKRLPIRFITYDDKSDPETSVKTYERLATVDKVDLFIGPYSSPITIRASTVAEKYGIPMVAVEANSARIYARGFKWLVGVLDEGKKYTYRYWDMIGKEGKVKSAALVVEDLPHALDGGTGAREKAKEYGIRIAFDQTLPTVTTDFTATITRIKALDPDLVFVSSFPPFSVTFMKQAKELGLNPRGFHVIHAAEKAIISALGKDAEYLVGQCYWSEKMTWGKPAIFKESLKRAGITLEDYPWSALRMYGYDAIKAGLEKAGTLDKEKLMEALRTLKYESIGGPNSFKANGVGGMYEYPCQVQKGTTVMVNPPEFATGRHLYPTPPWDKR